MTYIELFDKNAAENICASLVNPPERVVLIGGNTKQLQKHAERYARVFSERGHDVEFIIRSVNKNSMQSIIDALSEIVEKYDGCAFDLTGGDELYLVAAGIVSERYSDKNIQMHRFNIINGTIIDCDMDGNTIMEDGDMKMTVEENIRIYGGDIVYDTVKDMGTRSWDITEDFRRDILEMWRICSGDPRRWNAQTGLLGIASKASSFNDDLEISVSSAYMKEVIKNNGGKYYISDEIIKRLIKNGLIRDYEFTDKFFKLTFKNKQVKKCLTKAGVVLEMFVYLTAKETRDANGELVYNDVMTGVRIDWDGKIHDTDGSVDTENEIDVIMMHGAVPVFVSCKNGVVEIDELYKLNAVAERFGGKYSKKVLMATSLEGGGNFDEYFRQRAKDMSIQIVDDLPNIGEDKLTRAFRSFWSNT